MSKRWSLLRGSFLGLMFSSHLQLIVGLCGVLLFQCRKWIDSAVVGAFGSPAVYVRLVPRLDMVKEEGLEESTFSCFRGQRWCNSLSCLLDLAGILTGYTEKEDLIIVLVDANCVISIATSREVAR